MEIRSFEGNAAPRIVEGRTIEGYAAVYNQDSKVLFDKVNRRFFVERILPGAITEEVIARCDVKAYLEHAPGRMLARRYKGTGSLELKIDDYGLQYRFEAPETADGDYIVEMVRRGDIFGSSFAFLADEKNGVRYSRRPDGLLLREVSAITLIDDVSPVTNPAYTGTDVTVRSLSSYLGGPESEEYKLQINELRTLINN